MDNLEPFHPPLKRMASRLGKNFPPHLLDVDDLTQEGWIGILKAERSYDEDNFSRVATTAAWNTMISALRRLRFTGSSKRRGVRNIEINSYLLDSNWRSSDTRELEQNIDCRQFFEKSTTKEQKILQALSEGHTLRETGEMFDLTESRICQIRTDMRKRFRAEFAA